MFTQLETGAGLDIVLWIQSIHAAPLDALAMVLDFLGSDGAFVLMILFLYWCVNRHVGRRSLLLLIIVELATSTLKAIVQSPRPYIVAPDRVHLLITPGGYGIPSGHVMISLAMLGYVVMSLKIRRGWWLLAAYIALMAWSRMYGGAHYPQDALFGLIGGLLVLWAFTRVIDRIAGFWHGLTWQVKMVAVIIASLVIGLVFFSGEDSQMILGLCLGGGIGLVIEERWIAFDASTGNWPLRLIRYIIGVVLVAITYYALKYLFGDMSPEGVLRTIRYGAVGAMALLIYPWMCVRVGQMQRNSRVPVTQSATAETH